MRKIFGMLLLALVGAGVGFFAGEMYGREEEYKSIMNDWKHIQDEWGKNKQDEDKAKELMNTYQGKKDLDIAYLPPKPQKIVVTEYEYEKRKQQEDTDENEADIYLAENEHPMDDDEEENEDNILKKHPEFVMPKAYIHIVDEDYWDSMDQIADYSCVKKELRYFEDDEVLCDEDDELIDDPEELIGNEALNTFGQNVLNLPDEVFVENAWNETLYKITRIHNSYRRVVLGIDE